MGKHKKSKKSSKKHHKHKKSKHQSSDSETTSSIDEWVEKETKIERKSVIVENENKNQENREEWMNLPTLFATTSNAERRKERQEMKEKQKLENQYDPKTNVRELNPYWKSGGDGLPSKLTTKFIKPDNNEVNTHKSFYKSKSSGNWRKNAKQTITSSSDEQKTHEKNYSVIPSSSTVYISEIAEQNTHEKNEETLSDKQMNDIAAKIVKAEILGQTKIVEELKQKLDRARQICNIKQDTHETNDETLSDKQMNDIAAKIVKAEILGQTKTVEELKQKLDRAREIRNTKQIQNDDEILLTRTDTKGFTRPLNAPEETIDTRRKNKKIKIETHSSGERVKYFADDDKYSLKQMFENEKFQSVDKQNSEFLQLTGKLSKMDDDMSDIFTDKIRCEQSTEKHVQRERDAAIMQHNRITKSLDNCSYCLQTKSFSKHLIISLGTTIYLRLPDKEPLTEGHCLLIPIRHVLCATQLDENEWSEILDFRKALTNMFLAEGKDVIFYETVLNARSYSHMVINCIPMARESADLAPIYFKKAIDECESEWSTNKKLIALSGRDVRKAVPKGLAYFFVSFGMSEGYAHVIEDAERFPKYFGAEIIGGILDLDHAKWMRPRSQTFDAQKKRVLLFSDNWKEFDCTRNN